MSKMFTDLKRHGLNGPTMRTRWSAIFYAAADFDIAPLRRALQQAVDEVDMQMSTWKPDSDLMRLNRAPVGVWVEVPARLMEVLRLAIEIGRATGGAFDAAMGDAVKAWGFGPMEADQRLISEALAGPRVAAHDALELDISAMRVRKRAAVTLDLNGIAKGYGVDRLADTLESFGIHSGLVGIDGEMRALELRPDGTPWAIAVEMPDYNRRAPHSVLALHNGAVATSGDYRHWVVASGHRLSHTMDPHRGAPLSTPPASVTVVAKTCAQADAFATALMVLGPIAGSKLAQSLGLDVLFLLRDGETIRPQPVGALFSGHPYPLQKLG
ncbi:MULTISPECIES: FAD:protein FMN transferase [unclassified Brucella]|uniref:FAD:protein FMN transferase n=1 Tax=unclassified Brucella TaxID=2632610 RepID=UPI000D030F2E|nr:MULTISPECIES: FAD:protein FMN transferase [unclassified Brucella]